MGSYYWIKLWIDLLADPKMGPLRDRLWRRAIELFLVARTDDGDGYLPALDVVAWQLHLSVEELEGDLQDLEALTGIVEYRQAGWFVTNFAKRQASVSDKERQRRKRARDNFDRDNCHGDVTNRNLEAEAEAEAEDRGTEVQKEEVEAEAEPEAEPFAAAGIPARDPLPLLMLLTNLGVENPVKQTLAACSWVTVEYINEWWDYIESWPDATQSVKVKSLIVRLQERRQVPPDWRDGK